MLETFELLDENFQDDQSVLNSKDRIVLPSNFPDLGFTPSETILYLRLKQMCLECGKTTQSIDCLYNTTNHTERQLKWTLDALQNLNAVQTDRISDDFIRITLNKYSKFEA